MPILGTRAFLAAGLATMVFVGACTGAGSAAPSGRTDNPVGPHPAPLIPQPSDKRLNERTIRRLAPSTARIDLKAPTFSDPTNIMNPLFPISDLRSALLVGKLNGRPWSAETTLLPETKVISWNGQDVQTRQSQFIAYLDGRIFEVAVDLYAQADDGSVWYFGEDAFTYKGGSPADTEGTWTAGINGPPAMIMPGHPQVGNVYRTENIPGLVFEQVSVKRLGQTVHGPIGPVHGAMIAEELHMDEKRLEDKTFAPGYGEFFSGSGHNFEANALAVPVDALSSPTPSELIAISTGVIDILDALGTGTWSAASRSLKGVNAAWETFRSTGAPERLSLLMNHALDQLSAAVRARNSLRAPIAALGLGLAALGLQLRYRSPMEIDRARFELWTLELQADAAAGDSQAVVGDVTTLDWIRDRLPLAPADSSRVDDDLRSMEAAAESGELGAAADDAARLRGVVSALQLVS